MTKKREPNPRLRVLFIEELETVLGGNNAPIVPEPDLSGISQPGIHNEDDNSWSLPGQDSPGADG